MKTPNELWREGKRHIQKIAQRTIAKKKKSQYQWITNETFLEIEKDEVLKLEGSTLTKNERYTENIMQKFGKMIRPDKVKYINEQYETIEQNSITNTTNDLNRKVKNLTRKFRPLVDTIKVEEGKILNDGLEIKNRWK